ncbi:aldehyde dehydrogenase (NADP(+)) [Pseudomonas kulmbachensis]|uniref:aldehyde dehydrogenase (NADP(+)) n=1 Tax=Pseudomonas kulmbachensis TaxID=3043408 RepID=UPI002AB08D35|nr:aldehyde dehydrogenase (NADP(+)) [Pseudomonas sp. FLM 004-28]
MQLTGEQLIGYQVIRGKGRELLAINPDDQQAISTPVFTCATADLVDQACVLAEQAFDPFRATDPETRAQFLEAIADGIVELGSTLTERAHIETGLPMARLEGERGRTAGQLRLFASVLRQGRWQTATLDSALPERQPLPRPDLRMCKIPLGPVAVFGASNFPLAFSVAGGDTASALAAGCPVVVKAHRAHLGTSELVGRVIQEASKRLELPEGTFSLVVGDGSDVGQQLVSHPAIKAVGFTGSRAGGLALMRTCAARPEPIPVYAEMSSINPVFLLPGALANQASAIATAFVDALVMGAGQFCTNPGVVLAVEGPDLDAFLARAAAHLAEKAAQTMLTPGIHSAYELGVRRISGEAGIEAVASGQAHSGATQAQGHLYQTTFASISANAGMLEEVFGPAAIVIRCQNVEQMLAFAHSIEGQLTATLHLENEDLTIAQGLVQAMEKKAGRVLINGFPTGVEVCDSMVHGGAFPATSDSRTTSVGSTAIERFLRPVCYQNFPDVLLPRALKHSNPLNIWRQVDGKTAAPCS